MAEEKTSKKKSFWSVKRIGFLLLFIVILVLGAVLQHYVVEPFLNNSLQLELEKATSNNNLLNEENLSCITGKNSLQENLSACDLEKDSLQQEFDECNSDLLDCKKKLLESEEKTAETEEVANEETAN